MAFGPTIASRILGATLLGSTYTGIQTLYYGLCSSIGSQGLSYAEPATSLGYVRQRIIFGSESNRRSTNSNSFAFGASNTPWGAIGFHALFTDPTSGTLAVFGTLAETKTVATSVICAVHIGSITLRIDD